MLKDLVRLASWLRHAGFEEEAEEALELDEDWLKEVGIDRDAEEKKLESEEPELEESFEEKIPTSFDQVHWMDLDDIKSDIPKLKKADLIPVHADNKTVLGIGGYGRVYNVIWRGRPAAAKVGTNSDGEAWSQILKVKEKIPQEYHKHIPQIHEIIDEDGYSIIVMKKLVPMNDRMIGDWAFGRRESLSQSIVDFERAYRPADLIDLLSYNMGHLLPYGWEAKLSFPTIEEINSELSKEEPPKSKREIKRTRPEIIPINLQGAAVIEQIKYWQTGLSRAFYSVNSEFLRDKDSAFKGRLSFSLDSYVRLIYDGQYTPYDLLKNFPENPRAEKEGGSIPVEFQSFYNFLSELKKHNIVWSDLGRGDNVMIDPDTKEIVLTDVGNFHLSKSTEDNLWG